MKTKRCLILNIISSNEEKGLDKKYIEALNKSHFGSKKILDDVIKENQLQFVD
jgi:amidase